MLTTIATRCLNELPFDILTEIFSYLSQDECLTCMDAGPAWFHLVPHYSERVWENITLLERSFVKEDPRLKQCLGNHVKFVCLRVNRNKEILYDLLDKLAEYKCDQIERITLTRCSTHYQAEFLKHLQTLTLTRLTHLTLESHLSHISILHVLSICPNLSHLIFIPGPDPLQHFYIFNYEAPMNPDDRKNKTVNKTNSDNTMTTITIPDKFNHLIYLHIDAAMESQSRLMPILQKCPNLRCFVGTNYYRYHSCIKWIPSYSSASVDMDQLAVLCPKLLYFMGSGSYIELPEPIKKLQEARNCSDISNNNEALDNDGDSHHIEYLTMCEEYGQNRIVQCITKNQQTLQYLGLNRCTQYNNDSPTWSRIFRSLDVMPRLHTFICSDIHFDALSLMIMLSNCPVIDIVELASTEECSIRRFILDFSMMMNNHAIIVPTLRTLTLRRYSILGQPSITRMLQQLNGLEKLVVKDSMIHLNHPDTAFFIKSLKRLELSHVFWNEEEEGGHLQTYQLQQQQQQQQQDQVKSDPVLLPDLFQQLATHGSALESVQLSSIPHITSELLLAMAHIPTIKEIRIEFGEENLSTTATTMKDNHDLLLRFATKLCDTASDIEVLELDGICSIPRGVLTLLGKLSKLRTLSLQHSRRIVARGLLHATPGSLLKMDPEEVIFLLCHSRSLNEFRARITPKQVRLGNPRDYTVVRKLMQEHDISSSFTVSSTGYLSTGDMCIEEYYTVKRCRSTTKRK